MTIKNKLYLGIVLNMILVLGLSFVGFYGVNSIRNEMDQLTSDPVPSIITVNELSESFQSATEDIYAYQILGVKEEKESYYVQVKKFDQTLEKLKLLIKDYSPEQKEISSKIADDIVQAWAKYKKSVDVNISEYERNKKIDDVKFFSLFNSVEEIKPLLTKLIDSEKNEIKESQEKARKVALNSINLILIFVVLSVTISLLINLLIMHSITKPLHSLIDATSRFGLGDFQKRVQVLGKDEFGDLSQAFNLMADNIKTSQANLETKIKERTLELEKAKTGLEEAVAKRTLELQKLKDELEHTVAQRTKELTEKMTEMEKFNKLIVGRELSMADLKKKIEELERENKKLSEEFEKSKNKT